MVNMTSNELKKELNTYVYEMAWELIYEIKQSKFEKQKNINYSNNFINKENYVWSRI